MLVNQFISQNLYPLKKSDTILFAKQSMEDYQVGSLPVVQNKKLVCTVYLSQLESQDEKSIIKELVDPKPVAKLNHDASFFKAMKLFADIGSNVLAIEKDGEFFGIIEQKDMYNYLSKSYTVQGDGAIVYMQTTTNNYSLTAISRAVEMEDAKIKGLWTIVSESGMLQLIIKLDTQVVSSILNNLQQQNIEILVAVNQKDDEHLKSRYNALLKYLEL